MAIKRFQRWVRVAHYWAGAIVVLQLLIWLGTGIYFNVTPHHKLKGMQYNDGDQNVMQTWPSFDEKQLQPLAALLSDYPSMARVTLVELTGKPVYLLEPQVHRYEYQCQQTILVDAYSAQVILIDSTYAQALALQSYTGPGDIIQTRRLVAPFTEWPKQCNALWQVDMNDELNTRIYINSVNGQLVGHKNDHTDLADLMFKLHFMDYLHQGSFNNPFSWLFGLLMLMSSLSGLYWVIDNVRFKRYRVRVK